MVFQFAHVVSGWHPEKGKWHPLPFDLPRFKKSLFDWQRALADDGWNALFLNNHDLPRQVSAYGDDGTYRVRSAKALALALHLMKGTPFVYQGEEIGMTNIAFERIDRARGDQSGLSGAVRVWILARYRGQAASEGED